MKKKIRHLTSYIFFWKIREKKIILSEPFNYRCALHAHLTMIVIHVLQVSLPLTTAGSGNATKPQDHQVGGRFYSHVVTDGLFPKNGEQKFHSTDRDYHQPIKYLQTNKQCITHEGTFCLNETLDEELTINNYNTFYISLTNNIDHCF